MKLSPRLNTIANFVEDYSIVADIGTDHGYIPVYLIENNISKKIIATDISIDSLKKAQKYSEIMEYQDRIETRLGNGLEVIKPYETDVVIISGMGGLLIKEILEKNKDIAQSISYLILQPMIASDKLRKYLYFNNYKILDEKLSREGNRYYETILACHGKGFVNKDIYYEIGVKLIQNKDPLLKQFVYMKINKVKDILNKLDKQSTFKAKIRYKYLSKKLNQYKEVVNII